MSESDAMRESDYQQRDEYVRELESRNEALRAERDAALAEVDSLRGKHDAKVDRINALEAEVERMRPVVEAAGAIHEPNLSYEGQWFDLPECIGDPVKRMVRMEDVRRVWLAVQAFRASAQKEGE